MKNTHIRNKVSCRSGSWSEPPISQTTTDFSVSNVNQKKLGSGGRNVWAQWFCGTSFEAVIGKVSTYPDPIWVNSKFSSEISNVKQPAADEIQTNWPFVKPLPLVLLRWQFSTLIHFYFLLNLNQKLTEAVSYSQRWLNS